MCYQKRRVFKEHVLLKKANSFDDVPRPSLPSQSHFCFVDPLNLFEPRKIEFSKKGGEVGIQEKKGGEVESTPPPSRRKEITKTIDSKGG